MQRNNRDVKLSYNNCYDRRTPTIGGFTTMYYHEHMTSKGSAVEVNTNYRMMYYSE